MLFVLLPKLFFYNALAKITTKHYIFYYSAL